VVSDGNQGYCGVLTSGRAKCWGYGRDGELGNGRSYGRAPSYGHDVPVSVDLGSGDVVASLVSDSLGYCALLTSGGVECWGANDSDQAGGGHPFSSGVVALASDDDGYCALLSSGGVDCWGGGDHGQLGNGQFYTTGSEGSAVPVQVVGVDGTGTLSGVTSLVGMQDYFGYCALLTSGVVDCWGAGWAGNLGDGQFYTTGNEGSAVPERVTGMDGSGTLGAVADLISDGANGYCALSTHGRVDCWGDGTYGQLGDGQYYTTSPWGSAIPVQVEGTNGTGVLSGVAQMASSASGGSNNVGALLTSGRVDCWGFGGNGDLGNDQYYTTYPYGSAVPVQVQ